MPHLSVGPIDEQTYERLRLRAESRVLTVEEEARRILKRAIAAPVRLSDLARELFGPEHGVDLELPTHEPREAPRLRR
jgi:antitoxin FitA